ncbi:MAG TPA: glucose 1-dehydrogenase [Gemmatimonadaceae bacterium]|jgi:NAD(P)-dependent dehydrogenase (short-subunit alcohol dehydrogenase family)|nr:glucose 1-dehydrogenase [Gemmatimonadaceae bacterium]
MADQAANAVLAGRSAIVTGGGSGIGQAIALHFARSGARVAILDIGTAEETLGSIQAAGGEASAIRCDVTRQDDVGRAFAEASERFGALDILVTSAGVAHVGTVEQTTEADLDRLYAVNVKGVYNCLRLAVAAMKGRGGVILNVASVAASIGIPDRFAYSMTKGAVLSMTLSVARDYVEQGIRCNSISPARVHTPFVDGFLAKNYPGREAEMFAKLERTQPIGRMGRPAEIAELALYLCSDAASFITGTDYPIDGGFLTLKM